MARRSNDRTINDNVNPQEPPVVGDAHEPGLFPSEATSFDPRELEAAPAVSKPDPFDLASLRLDPNDFEQELGVRRALLSVPVRKPDKAWWIRTHPSEEYRLNTAVIELADKSMYLVAGQLRPVLTSEATFKPKLLVTGVNRQGVLFLWPLAQPSDGSTSEWTRTALEAAEMGRRGWVRVVANMQAGCYDVFQTRSAALGDPQWPSQTFQELLSIAFRERYIRDLNHIVLRQLRGEV